MIDADEEEFESHFVENPFIKLREKALSKNLNAKQHLGLSTLEGEDKTQDIYIMEETGKFMIRDFEDEESKKKKMKQLKRTREQALGSEDVDMNESSSDEEDNGALKKRMQGLNKKQSNAKNTESMTKDTKQSKQ